jgi:hypothetical protein
MTTGKASSGPRRDSWLRNPSPALRAHLQAVLSGEFKFGTHSGSRSGPTWSDIPREKRRVVFQCRHWRPEPTPRLDIGGVTRDRVYGLEGDGVSLTRAATKAKLPCPTCGTTWLLPVAEARRIAQTRGGRLLQQPVDEVPGVDVDVGTGSV